MSKSTRSAVIRLRGVRQNNLKHFDIDLPLRSLIVVTGLSGSGKSSLAFDTLYAEGQRRYIETFSPYARQFFDRMDRPQVDSIHGIPPAIAIEQRNAVKTTRSTVGTMTEICDHTKVVWSHFAQLHCRGCGNSVRKETAQQVWECLAGHDTHRTESSPAADGGDVLVTFELALSDRLSLADSLELMSRQGYQRLLFRDELSDPRVVRLDELSAVLGASVPRALTVVQDRLRLTKSNRARFVEACEQAYHFGKGRLSVFLQEGGRHKERRFSRQLHCAACDLEYREPTAALFSFNHPVGACPTCRGFGRTIAIDYDLAIPDRSLSLKAGAVKPWQSGHGLESQNDLMTFCKRRKVPVDVPFDQLDPKWQNWVIEGDPDYGKDAAHEWPKAWYGVKGYFRWLESKAYKMHVRVLLSRYRAYRTCDDCQGRRFQPDSLLYRIRALDERDITLADFYQMPVREALQFIQALAQRRTTHGENENKKPTTNGQLPTGSGEQPATTRSTDPLSIVLEEVRSRLAYLDEVGLGYLTLDRPTRTLSGGETERVNLTTCLGSRLVNTLFVLDEPSVGLHARDTQRLISILQRLRDGGNTVVVVEHETSVMRAADQIVDLGPGQGEAGGHLVFQGGYEAILTSANSITGQYLSGRKCIEIPERRAPGERWLRLRHATCHNVRDLAVDIPLERFVCLTGVSGSGKTTLMRDVLLPLLEAQLKRSLSRLESTSNSPATDAGEPDEGLSSEDADGPTAPRIRSGGQLTGSELLGQAILVDQSPIGRTPRSNPAVYIGAFEPIREVFAATELARQLGLKASAFSFNSSQGQCQSCRGAGFEKIEMQFLSDIFVRCSECQGRRYRPHILEISAGTDPALRWNIADLLEATVDQAIDFLRAFDGSRFAAVATTRLQLLQEVGLGYLRLGQPVNTLSGGESQRLKLVRHLADFRESDERKPTLFLFDEPTTGLHMHDVSVLLRVFQRLVDAGHSVVVIEHNLDVIKSADWIIDLGPEAGAEGGRIVAQGPPETIVKCPASHTGRALAAAA